VPGQSGSSYTAIWNGNNWNSTIGVMP
jgi:hypothetical protein